jgi:hypothetical protein
MRWNYEGDKLTSTLIKKEPKIFLIYMESQMGSVAKSYMRKDFLIIIYEEMRKYLVMYEEAVIVIFDFAVDPF